jgi:hypothetical protein
MSHPPGQPAKPVALGLDAQTWQQHLERVDHWLVTTALLQSTFRRLVDDVARGVDEPHIRTYLFDVSHSARDHETVVDELYAAFGREPGRRRWVGQAGAAVLATARGGAGQVVGLLAGARSGSWRGMRELMRSNLDALSAYAVTEQLGLVLGVPEVIDLVVPVQQEKQQHQLMLKEYLLEMASNAVLSHRDF